MTNKTTINNTSTNTGSGPQNRRGKKNVSLQVHNVNWLPNDQRVVTIQAMNPPSLLLSNPTSISSSLESKELPTSLKVWDSMTGDLLRAILPISLFETKVLAIHPFLSDVVLTGSNDGKIVVWNIDKETPICSSYVPNPVDNRLPSVLDAAFSEDGNFVACTDALGRIVVLSVANEERYKNVKKEQYFSSDYAEVMHDHNGMAIDLATRLPVHISPRGPLCKQNGTPYDDIDSSIRLSGPDPISIQEVYEIINNQKECKLNLDKNMEKILATFLRHKTKGRQQKNLRWNTSNSTNYSEENNNNTSTMQGNSNSMTKFGRINTTNNNTSSNGNNRNTTSSYTTRHWNIRGVEDINQYIPSSDDSSEDSEWDNNNNDSPFNVWAGRGAVPRINHHTNSSSSSHAHNSNISSNNARRARRLTRNSNRNANNRSTNNRSNNRQSTRLRSGRDVVTLHDNSEDEEERYYNNNSNSDDEDDDDDEDRIIYADSHSDDSNTYQRKYKNKHKQSRRGRPRKGLIGSDSDNNDSDNSTKSDDLISPYNTGINKKSSPISEHKPKRKAIKYNSGTWGGQLGSRSIPLGIDVDREWLQQSTQVDYQYSPQVGDIVYYFPQGHMEILQIFTESTPPPWLSFAQKWCAVECLVNNIIYDFPTSSEYRRCTSVLATLTLTILKVPQPKKASPAMPFYIDFVAPRATRHSQHIDQIITVTLRNSDLAEFIILKPLVDKALRMSWYPGMSITAKFLEPPDNEGNKVVQESKGCILSMSDSSNMYPHSPWDALTIRWEPTNNSSSSSSSSSSNSNSNNIIVVNQDAENSTLSPWEAVPHAAELLPTINTDEALRIENEIKLLLEQSNDVYTAFEFEVDSETYPEYYTTIPVPMYIDLIRRRLLEGYYRQVGYCQLVLIPSFLIVISTSSSIIVVFIIT